MTSKTSPSILREPSEKNADQEIPVGNAVRVELQPDRKSWVPALLSAEQEGAGLQGAPAADAAARRAAHAALSAAALPARSLVLTGLGCGHRD